MIAQGGAKLWYTAAELADMALPGVSRAKRKVNEAAALGRWALKTSPDGAPLARPRPGRGGGLEYHFSLLPASAQLELVKRGIASPGQPCLSSAETNTPGQLWSWFEAQPQKVRDEAARRLSIVDKVDAARSAGLTVTAAIATVGAQAGVCPATISNWRALADGARRDDRLPRLAPRRQGGGCTVDIDAGAWQFFLSDYLRPSAPTLASCYERAVHDYAAPRGLVLPHAKTFARKLEREIDGRLIIAKRTGQDALRGTVPYQQRTVADLSALELVNIDGHRWDVFVRWPDGTIARPMMIAIQDVYSRKFLSWRTGQTESAVQTRLAFADLFRKYGIPGGCLMDNGRAFASKWITGGAASRFRFKIRPEEPTGLLTGLGIAIHWALPFRGSSKPIERMFRDFCDAIAKHPSFNGAYTGNKPTAKPEDYGTAAVDLDIFLAVTARAFAAHNAKIGRRTEIARGSSFDAAFEASYTRSPIAKPTPEQLRLALLAADQVTADRKTGAISLYGNRYWTEALFDVAGQKVTVRFDPDDLHSCVHVYRPDGGYLATAPVLAATGFLDAGAAKDRARQEAAVKKHAKALETAQDLLSAAQLAAMIPDTVEDDEPPQATVLRPVRTRGLAAAPAHDSARPAIDRFLDMAPSPAPEPRRFSLIDGGRAE